MHTYRVKFLNGTVDKIYGLLNSANDQIETVFLILVITTLIVVKFLGCQIWLAREIVNHVLFLKE